MQFRFQYRALNCTFALSHSNLCSKSFQYRCIFTSTHPQFRESPPHRSLGYKLRSLWLKIIQDPLYPIHNDQNFVGVDRFGNEYYEYYDALRVKKRMVKVKGVDLADAYNTERLAMQIEKSRTIPMEWKSWLQFSRMDAPDIQEQERLEKERAWRAIKAREWDELQMREEIRAGNVVNPTILKDQPLRGSNTDINPEFQDYIRKQKERSEKMDQNHWAEAESTSNEFNEYNASHSSNTSNSSNISKEKLRENVYAYDRMSIEDARSINEEMQLNRPVGTVEGYVPPHAETMTKPENKKTPHFFPSASLARDYAGVYEENEEGDQGSRERNLERLASMNRTSKFLGVRPTIRPDAMQKLKDIESERKRQEIEKKESN